MEDIDRISGCSSSGGAIYTSPCLVPGSREAIEFEAACALKRGAAYIEDVIEDVEEAVEHAVNHANDMLREVAARIRAIDAGEV